MHEEVLPQLRQMVVEGRWGPNETLPELQISEELGISRTPVREAVKILVAEGLLEVRPRSGASLKIMSPTEVRQLFEAAGAIEGVAATLAATRFSGSEIKKILQIHGKMVAAYNKSKRSAYFELNQQVHILIVKGAQNEVLSEIHQNLLMKMRRVRYACTNEVGIWQNAIEEHEAIADAVANRDGARLSSLLITHMQRGWARVSDFVKDEFEKN